MSSMSFSSSCNHERHKGRQADTLVNGERHGREEGAYLGLGQELVVLGREDNVAC